jgi:hypothetical protein
MPPSGGIVVFVAGDVACIVFGMHGRSRSALQ